jgi:hypothetical protein
MLDFKLIKLMQVLTSKEILDVERHLGASFFNPTEDVQKLFCQISKFHPNFENPKLTKERLYAKLYGKQPYNDGKMRKLMTQLTQLIEQYLMQKELKHSEELQTRLLARSLGERNNYELYLDVVESRLKDLDRQVERGRDYFRESYELSEMLYYHPGSGKLSKRNEYYGKAITDFERYFTLVMLQNEADNVVRTRLVREHGSSAYLDLALQVADEKDFAAINTIHFFRHIIMLLKGEVDDNLDELRETAFGTFGLLSRFEKDFAINLLRNYAVPMSNNGSIPHRKFVLDLYKMELSQGLLANTISSTAFMNIVSVALAVGELDWVKFFLDEFSQNLSGDDREITLYYCQGVWCYYKGLESNQLNDFYEALQSMNRIPIRTGPNYEIRVRPSMLRIHFEIFERRMESLDELLNHVRNFERHLNGSGEYAEPTRNSYLNFLRFFKSLARLIANPDSKKQALFEFVDKLNHETLSIAHKGWLIEKANGLAHKS